MAKENSETLKEALIADIADTTDAIKLISETALEKINESTRNTGLFLFSISKLSKSLANNVAIVEAKL